jgi:hypothetical protein
MSFRPKQHDVAVLQLLMLFRQSAGSAAAATNQRHLSARFACLSVRVQGLQASQHTQQRHSGLLAQQTAEAKELNDYYHYQDELALSSTPGDALAPEELEERNAYVVEDPETGRTAVIEQEARPLPGGGRVFWTRKTAPGSEVVTTVISGSSGPAGNAELAGAADTARSSSGLAQQLAQHVFGASFGSAFAPLNDLMDAVDAQQQRLGSMMTARYVHAAAAAAAPAAPPHSHHRYQQQQQHHHHMHHSGMHHNSGMHHGSGVPCPRHQALMAAAAAAAAEARASAMSAATNFHHRHFQQQQQDGEVVGLESLFSQQLQQQHEQARAEAQQQQLQEELAAAGLTLSAHGAVVPLLLPPLPPQQQQQQQQRAGSKEYVYVDYTDDESAAAAAKLEALYDTMDDDYAFVPASLDGVVPRLDDAPIRGSSSSSSSSILDGLDVDLALLVLLVAATAGMCMAFLQSLLQLREALHAQQQPAAPFMLSHGKPLQISAVAGARNNSDDELTQPLLVSPRDSEGAQEQQQQQRTVQRFYNPLCYQQLPSGQV